MILRGIYKCIFFGIFLLYIIEMYHKINFQYDNDFDGNKYRKVSNIRRTLVGNKIVAHSDVVGALPVGAAPTTSSFST